MPACARIKWDAYSESAKGAKKAKMVPRLRQRRRARGNQPVQSPRRQTRAAAMVKSSSAASKACKPTHASTPLGWATITSWPSVVSWWS